MKKILLAVILVMTALPGKAEEVYRDAGAGAFSFLKIDPGARAAALGGTGLLNSGELALFTNPALMASMGSSSVSAGHNRWLGDATQNFISWNFSLGGAGCGLGTRSVYVGGIEMREGATSQPVTTFSAWDISLHAAAGIRLGMFDLGLGLKVIREKIWTESATGFAADAGVVIHPTDALELAAAVQHAGPSVTMVDDAFRLPATWRLGGRYTTGILPGRTSISIETGKPLDNRPTAGCGLEYQPQRWIDLRLGMRFSDDSRKLTCGTGLRAGGWSLDYAFVPTSFALGTVHRFTLHRSL
ncbi:MAG: PorV/PorQ family protein [Candidatus Aegiribacteria sp.]